MSPAQAAMLGAAAWMMLSGCSGPRGPAFRPEVVEPAKAVIYVYRPARLWAGTPVGISIDQQTLGRLDAGQYVARLVEPGVRVVRAVGASDAVKQVRLIAGDSAFLEVRSSYWDQRPVIELIDEQAARERIAHTGNADAPR